MNKSYVMLKPDCFERNLVDTLIQEIKDNGFRIEAEKEVVVDEKRILKHYEEVIERLNSDSFKESVLKAFVGKKVLALEITNDTGDCVTKFRELIGPTDPAKADKNTLRGKYGNDSMEKSKAEGRMLNNLIHASDSEDSAKKELGLWFE
ncbi:nucleoside-diphosphate kinase [Anaerorhabdus sp.]|uniref:nucleoside-diphosphate kinase n=1 Tax=bioreactor metagenome TaxID=1076179 RepID=A0A645I8J1_9ZZZZ|nr:nucleoside-diphosphate kinase [Anaerorhabdus sp.]MEA4875381.1 nucleoside-diphosphate kinase [Anaerorhabdus sp.]